MNDLEKQFSPSNSELLCPYKCQGMSFLIYPDDNVKCRTCKQFSKLNELLRDY